MTAVIQTLDDLNICCRNIAGSEYCKNPPVAYRRECSCKVPQDDRRHRSCIKPHRKFTCLGVKIHDIGHELPAPHKASLRMTYITASSGTELVVVDTTHYPLRKATLHYPTLAQTNLIEHPTDHCSASTPTTPCTSTTSRKLLTDGFFLISTRPTTSFAGQMSKQQSTSASNSTVWQKACQNLQRLSPQPENLPHQEGRHHC